MALHENTTREHIKLAIVGSRTFSNYKLLNDSIENEILPFCIIDKIISGGANGADKLGAKYASKNNIPLVEIKPDWGTYGKSAGFLRNYKIIDACDVCIAFWDGESKGTAHDIGLAKKKNKGIIVIRF